MKPTLNIPKTTIAEARKGLSACTTCRSLLADAETLGFPQADIERLINEAQPQIEGLLQYVAINQGSDTNG
jgi:hypothetical protein